MKRARRAWPLVMGMVLVLFCGLLAAAGEADEPSGELPDFRGKVMLAYGLLFALLIGYLWVSHGKNSGLQEELEFLERRVRELKKRGAKEEASP